MAHPDPETATWQDMLFQLRSDHESLVVGRKGKTAAAACAAFDDLWTTFERIRAAQVAPDVDEMLLELVVFKATVYVERRRIWAKQAKPRKAGHGAHKNNWLQEAAKNPHWLYQDERPGRFDVGPTEIRQHLKEQGIPAPSEREILRKRNAILSSIMAGLYAEAIREQPSDINPTT